MEFQINHCWSSALPPSTSDDAISDGARVRACEACRLSKVRCEKPHPGQPCSRCAKAWRVCVPASQNRTHRKRSPYHHQLNALEDHVRRLVNTMGVDLGRGGETATEGRKSDKNYEYDASRNSQIAPFSIGTIAGDAERESVRTAFRPMGNLDLSLTIQSVQGIGRDNAHSAGAFIDATLRRILDTNEAEKRFQYYCSQLAPTFPAVVFEPPTTAQAARSTTPILFLAAITVARIYGVESQRQLDDLLSQVIEYCYLRRSTYSLELVQAVVLAALWHKPSYSSEREGMDLQQLSHAASSIATLVGLGRTTAINGTPGSGPALTARRTWVACYHICVNTALRTAECSSISWGPYMEECLDVLETSPLPSDATLSRYTRLEQVSVEYRQLLRGSQALSTPTDTLQAYQQQIGLQKQWRSQHDSLSVERILYHAAALTVYEAAVEKDERLAGIFDNSKAQAEASHSLCAASQPNSILTTCMDSARAVLREFVSVPQNTLCALPTIVHLRVMHATVLLTKATSYLPLSCPSAWCPMARIEELHTDRQLDELINVFASCRDDWLTSQWIHAILKLRAKMRQQQEQLTRTKRQCSGSIRATMICSSTLAANMYPFTPTPTVNLQDAPSPPSRQGLSYEPPVSTPDVLGLTERDWYGLTKPDSTGEREGTGNIQSPLFLEEYFSLESTGLGNSDGFFTPSIG